MLRNLLLYRFLLVNLAGFLGLGLAWEQGLIDLVFLQDRSHITWLIATMFAVVWFGTVRRCWSVSHALNTLKRGQHWTMSNGAKAKVWAKIEWMRDMTSWLVGVGLIGTVIGFTIALSAIEPDSLGAVSGVSASIATLMAGMKIALNTTIVGAILSIWNEINQRMLRTAVTGFLADITDAQEKMIQDQRDGAKQEKAS